MRPYAPLAAAVVLGLSACGIEQLTNGTGSGTGGADAGSGEAGDGGPSISGAGCGTERQTGIALCAATSMCPELVVDTQAFPSCGFRIRGTAVDLVCGCGEYVCPMGVFATCTQAAELLVSQTEQTVCAQIGEGRCTTVAPAGSSTSSGSGGASSSSSGGTGCNMQCYDACGGGDNCAMLCNCK